MRHDAYYIRFEYYTLPSFAVAYTLNIIIIKELVTFSNMHDTVFREKKCFMNEITSGNQFRKEKYT